MGAKEKIGGEESESIKTNKSGRFARKKSGNLVVIDYVTTARGTGGYKSDRKEEEEVGRMMNVLSEPSRQRGSVARL